MVAYASRDEMLAAYGPFRVLFEPTGTDRNPYLALLGLQHPRAADVLRTIRAVATAPDSAPFVVTLLRDINWRPQLVGAVATYYTVADGAISQMWAALDAGSWVAPQLACVLVECDPDFTGAAKIRLASGCPLSGNPEYSMDSLIVRHSAQGPAGVQQRSAKSAASLFALLPHDCASDFASNNDLQSLIADDCDGSAKIATSWLEKFLKLDAQL